MTRQQVMSGVFWVGVVACVVGIAGMVVSCCCGATFPPNATALTPVLQGFSFTLAGGIALTMGSVFFVISGGV